jgi:hypothetical protein
MLDASSEPATALKSNLRAAVGPADRKIRLDKLVAASEEEGLYGMHPGHRRPLTGAAPQPR